jgi:hypothetical protein
VRGEAAGHDRVLRAQNRQGAAPDLLEHLHGVSVRGQADGDERRAGGDAHDRTDGRPHVVDVVAHGEQAHAGGVLAQRGREVRGVDGHGQQSITPGRISR